jgi:uncharacterized protein (TIGR02453 family)
LLAELAGEFGEGRIFRPYRDVRFSPNKSPYKTAMGATVGDGYVQISADGLMSATGMYHMMPDQLDRYRRAVADDRSGPDLERVVASLEKAKVEVNGIDALKTAPKGYPKDHPRVELLRNKGLIAGRRWPVASWLGTASARTRIVEVLRAAQPLNDWLSGQVGPSTMEDDPGGGRRR